MRHLRAHGGTANLGIVTVNAELEPLYMNPEAQAICRRLASEEGPTPAVLPPGILGLCQDIAVRLKQGTQTCFEQAHVRCMGEMESVLLRGFSIPTGTANSSLIIVLMESLGAEPAAELRKAQARFKLTDREMHVAEHLARGLTNKEIALTLQITEQTVKQHLKHMMVKTKANTRTGVLAQLLGNDQGAGPATRSGYPLRRVS